MKKERNKRFFIRKKCLTVLSETIEMTEETIFILLELVLMVPKDVVV